MLTPEDFDTAMTHIRNASPQQLQHLGQIVFGPGYVGEGEEPPATPPPPRATRAPAPAQRPAPQQQPQQT
jgi:hypothetical protein